MSHVVIGPGRGVVEVLYKTARGVVVVLLTCGHRTPADRAAKAGDTMACTKCACSG